MGTCTLIILDGIGIRDAREANAYAAAHTPMLDRLLKEYPSAQIATSGLAVGLPAGQMGNSEVGHMNLGAGRVVYQSLARINQSISDGSFAMEPELVKLLNGVQRRGGALHLIGLLSSGGVHSHIDQMIAACHTAAVAGIDKLYVHAFLDGRDTPPRCAEAAIEQLESELAREGFGRIATIIGRYFALDRDNRWDRVESAYRLIMDGHAQHSVETAQQGLAQAYARGETDEFVQATRVGEAAPVAAEDAVIFMNFRPDRARQLCQAFITPGFSAFARSRMLGSSRLLTLTRYADDLPCPCVFPPQALSNSLGEYMASLGKRQLRIAETEKYAHVTFFFNGGREAPFDGESRTLIPSPKIASYDLQPEMSAPQLTEKLVEAIRSDHFDLIVCNYANGDMVGHTGVFDAAVKAVEAVDRSLEKVVQAIIETGSNCLITADHGNVEQMVDHESGQTHTSHTLNPVPLILVGPSSGAVTLDDGRLCDIAPTVLQLLDLAVPVEMEGQPLIRLA